MATLGTMDSMDCVSYGTAICHIQESASGIVNHAYQQSNPNKMAVGHSDLAAQEGEGCFLSAHQQRSS